MKQVHYLLIAIFAMLLVGCGPRQFTIPQAKYSVVSVGEGDSLKYVLHAEIPENIQWQLLCTVIDGDTVINEYQKFNSVIGEFEPFQTYPEPKNYHQFISALPDYKKAVEAISKLQKDYERYTKYLSDVKAWEERVKDALPAIIKNHSEYENSRDHFEKIRYEQAMGIIADVSDYDGELSTKKATNEYGAEITYTYYIENGKEVKHGTYTCVANLDHVTYKPGKYPYEASYDLTGTESISVDYRRGIIHGRIIYDCDLEIVNNRNNAARHETEHYVHYLYKGRLDGDINFVTRGFSYKGYSLGSIARRLSAIGERTGITELTVSDEG